ncbi:hypothetical protein MBLNU457_6396t1 [Dothideomycetes sp. NU457]
MAEHPPPPPPPPHGTRSSKLPDGNYDIFIIPPHSAGSGFLYLPSLKPNINSYIAGVFSGVLIMLLERMLEPLYRQLSTLSVNNGLGFFVLFAAVGAAFMFGRTQGERWAGQSNGPGTGPNEDANTRSNRQSGPQPNTSYPGSFGQEEPPPRPEPPKPKPADTSGPTPWEKAREEVRKREAERKRTEDLKKKQEEAQKKKEEDEKAKKAAAEKEKWEQARAREKDAREREARERLAKAKTTSKGGNYEKPSAQTYAESTTSSWQTYDEPRRRIPLGSSASSVSGLSESSYATMSTARTTPPPPSQRGLYNTKDPDKIIISAVYLFNNQFPKPVSQLISNEGSVTDGLILRITTEGLFIDDDVRQVPQREWDVKAWGIKLVETGKLNKTTVFRATVRDTDQKRYTFVLPSDEAWKVDMGLEKLRKGPLVRAMGMNGIKDAEMKNILSTLGW